MRSRTLNVSFRAGTKREWRNAIIGNERGKKKKTSTTATTTTNEGRDGARGRGQRYAAENNDYNLRVIDLAACV